MQDWKVAVLVVIIVAFLVLAALLLFLLYRYGNWRRFVHRKSKTTLRYIDDVEETTVRNTTTTNTVDNGGNVDMYQQLFLHDPRLHRSPHLLHFLDFQGELLCLDFKKKSLHRVSTEAALQQYLFDTYHPTIEDGNRVITVTAEMLALSYVDDRQTLVVLDANRLIARDAEFGARLMHTAERPLLLSRLVPDGVDGTVYTTLSRFGYSVGAAPTVHVRSEGNYLIAPPSSTPQQQQQQQQRQEIVVDVAQSRSNPMAFASPAVPPPLPPISPQQQYHLPPYMSSAVAAASSPATPTPAPASSVFAQDVPGMAPLPIIHPSETHHITTSTPITITAATYTVLHANGARSVLDVDNTAAIESARLRWDRRQSLVVTLVSGALASYQCVIDPVTENGNLLPPRGTAASTAEPIVCQRADALQYTVERVNSTQWLPVERSIYLPAGRWCVRARSLLYSDDSSKSTAKVFTVNVM